jgi:hypothetical protein
MGKLVTSYHDIDKIDDGVRGSMYALFEQYYDAVSMEQFVNDLESKTLAILLHDHDGVFQGFSTIEVIHFETEGDPAIALYSGDTIINHQCWGEHQLAEAWCYFAGQIKQQYPDVPLYWFLLVKGHRTYRLLPAFTREYYPNAKSEMPPNLRKLVDQLATDKFGDAYLPEAGILHFSKSHGHLRPEWTQLSDDVKSKRHVAFFLQANPGYISGDELVCLTELSERNMRFISRTAFTRGMNSCPDGAASDQASPESATL